MIAYIIRRILYVIPIALSVSLICFMLVHIAPGDPVDSLVSPDAPQEVVAEVRQEYGLDKPLPVQFAIWLDHVAHGDLGTSLASGRPVWPDLKTAIKNTLVLAFTASIAGFVLGCLLGGLAGVLRDSWVDRSAVGLAVAGVSVPHYWFGMVLVIVFSVELNWLPAIGLGPSGSSAWTWDWGHVSHLLLPAATLAVVPMGVVTRTVRGLVSDILNQDFITTLRGKGIRNRGIFLHVMKNAAPNAVAIMGLQLGYLMGGSILVETVFSWPGTGFMLYNAIFARDIPVLQATVLVLAMVFVVLNLLVDLLQTALDPRIRRV